MLLPSIFKLASQTLLTTSAITTTTKPTVYFIRHGEKPSSGNGLNAEGLRRAECLRDVFGLNSQYNIGHIIAQTPKPNGHRLRPHDTVLPLAQDLGLQIDISCQRDDSPCVKNIIENYTGSGNILICWEHKAMSRLAETLGDDTPPKYPKHSFDYIWTDPYPYHSVVDTTTSEQCPGLDVLD